MKIRDILRHKGSDVVTASTGDSVLQVVQVLVDQNIGGVVVVDGEEVIGILTERDILRLTATKPDAFQALEVGHVMTRDVIKVAPDDDLAHVMEVMTEKRIRHLPVMEEGRLAGIVTIGDVVNAFRRVAEDENAHLRQYIQAGS
jgi:CBS domain-containing protein